MGLQRMKALVIEEGLNDFFRRRVAVHRRIQARQAAKALDAQAEMRGAERPRERARKSHHCAARWKQKMKVQLGCCPQSLSPQYGELVSRHRSDVVGCAQPSERSARRIAQPIQSVLVSDATPRWPLVACRRRTLLQVESMRS